MKNQVIGVKFLATDDYEDLLEQSLVTLTTGKRYNYFCNGFKVKVGDLVIVPNSGYNHSAVVPAVVTKLDVKEDAFLAKRPILAVISQKKLREREDEAQGIQVEIDNRNKIFNQLQKTYEQELQMQQIEKMAKNNPTLKKLLAELQEQDRILKKHHIINDSEITTAIDSFKTNKKNSDDVGEFFL